MLIFSDKYEIESSVVDFSSHGLRVSIPPSSVFLSIPQKNETVEIVFTTIQLQLTCRCIYLMTDQNGGMLFGFYVFDPDDQSKLRKISDTIDCRKVENVGTITEIRGTITDLNEPIIIIPR